MNSSYLTVTPAYGRDYTSKKAALADWSAGKDFIIQDMFLSGYVNKDDAPKGATVNIRFKRMTQVCSVKVV